MLTLLLACSVMASCASAGRLEPKPLPRAVQPTAGTWALFECRGPCEVVEPRPETRTPLAVVVLSDRPLDLGAFDAASAVRSIEVDESAGKLPDVCWNLPSRLPGARFLVLGHDARSPDGIVRAMVVVTHHDFLDLALSAQGEHALARVLSTSCAPLAQGTCPPRFRTPGGQPIPLPDDCPAAPCEESWRDFKGIRLGGPDARQCLPDMPALRPGG